MPQKFRHRGVHNIFWCLKKMLWGSENEYICQFFWTQDVNWMYINLIYFFWMSCWRSIYVLCPEGILVAVFFFRSFQGSWTLRSFLMIVSSGVILPLCFLRISSLASLNAASMAFYSIFILIVSISHALRVLVNRAKRPRFSLIHTKLRNRHNFTEFKWIN